MITFTALLLGVALVASGNAQEPLCPDPTGSATISWPDDLYARMQITVAIIGSEDSVTTYTGIECEGNPHSMTIAAGPSTFSMERPGGSDGTTTFIQVDECSALGDSMECTFAQREPGTLTITRTIDNDGIYDVTMALGPSGSFEPGSPTMVEPQYTGCPADYSRCDNGWCCPGGDICTTLSVVGYEACASATDDDKPGPALPYITAGPNEDPDGESGDESTGAAVPAHPRATGAPEIVGGIVGMAMMFM